jgi:hypothetical protein
VSDAEERGNRQWLVEPVGPNQVRVHVDVGEGVEISEEGRAALDRLLDELQASEVEGFAGTFPHCPELRACGDFHCVLGKCNLTKAPCFADVACFISP